MKIFQIFNKTPNYKRFNYTPRFYDEQEEERKARIDRITKEFNDSNAKALEEENPSAGELSHRSRMRGSFSRARQEGVQGSSTGSGGSSTTLIRFSILLVLTLGLIGYLQYGSVAIYGVLLGIVPIFLYMRFKQLSNRGR